MEDKKPYPFRNIIITTVATGLIPGVAFGTVMAESFGGAVGFYGTMMVTMLGATAGLAIDVKTNGGISNKVKALFNALKTGNPKDKEIQNIIAEEPKEKPKEVKEEMEGVDKANEDDVKRTKSEKKELDDFNKYTEKLARERKNPKDYSSKSL